MKEITVSELIKAVSGTLLAGNAIGRVNGVCIDSRKAESGRLFFAIPGKRVDGHDYLENAILAGCAALVVTRGEASALALAESRGIAVIQVKNTETALQDFAKYYLSLFQVRKIGVTGSTGKTTTKEMLYRILTVKFQTARNLVNYNNLIGLPLSVFEVGEGTEAVVLEMGMDRPGEIHALADIVRPDIGIITNIGLSHIEHLGTRENILKAKMEITDFFSAKNVLVLNTDNDLLATVEAESRFRLVSTGKKEEAVLRIENVRDLGEEGIEFRLTGFGQTNVFRLGLPGIHNASNAALAVAAAMELGITMEEAAQGLSKLSDADKRLHITEKNGIKVIDDTYNASPDSMRAAIDVLSGLKGKRRIAILGDMYELGDKEKEYHFQIGEYASQAGIHVVISVGKNAGYIAEGARKGGTRAVHFETKDLLLVVLAQWIREGDVVLVKGSRGMAMEKIVAQLEKAGE